MSISALDIGAVLILVLPGFLSYRSALARRADTTRRSALWQLSEILEYSVYIHLLGVALVFGIAAFLRTCFGIETHLREIPGIRPDEFLQRHFHEGVLLFTLYPLYVIVAAITMGAYELPTWSANRMIRAITWATRLVGRIPGIRWIKPPIPPYPAEPIWYSTFHVTESETVETLPAVLVRMKSGDIYYGYIRSYPILPDSQRDKDFLITQAIYSKVGNQGHPIRLSEQQGGGTVLLNTANVDSIQVYYVNPNAPANTDEPSETN